MATKKVIKPKAIEVILYSDFSCDMEKLVIVKDGKKNELFEANTWDYHGKDRFDAICESFKVAGVEFTAKEKEYTYSE